MAKKYEVVVAICVNVMAENPWEAQRFAEGEVSHYSDHMFEIVGSHANDVTDKLLPFTVMEECKWLRDDPCCKTKTYYAHDSFEAFDMAEADGFIAPMGIDQPSFKQRGKKRKEAE